MKLHEPAVLKVQNVQLSRCAACMFLMNFQALHDDLIREECVCHIESSTFGESVCLSCSSSFLETVLLALDVGLVGSLEGLASISWLLHDGMSWEETGLLDSSSSELRL